MLKLAFLNMTRNLRRTILTAFAIFISVFIIIAILSFLFTIIDDMVENTKSQVSGDIRIRNSKYSEYEDLMPLQFYVENVEEVEDKLFSLNEVVSVEPVIKMYSSVYSDGELKNGPITGAELDGVFFSPDFADITGRAPKKGEKEILVTAKFLRDFELNVGDSVTVVTNTVASSSNASTYKIVGEVFYNNAELNISSIVIPLDMLQTLTHMEDGALEVLVRVDAKENEMDAVADKIEKALNLDYLEILTWHDATLIYTMERVYNIMYVIIEALFFLISSTLIVNTTMMSVIERKKECATMIAMGFSREKVRGLFILEGVLIAFIGAVTGIAVGYLMVRILGRVGIDVTMFGADAVEGWSFPHYLYLRINEFRMFLVGIAAILVSFVATLFGTMRIKKIEVADELREEM